MLITLSGGGDHFTYKIIINIIMVSKNQIWIKIKNPNQNSYQNVQKS